MQPISVRVAGSVTSNPIPLDYITTPFQVAIGVGNVVGAVSYKMQYTYDEVLALGYNPAAASSTWFDSALMTGKTAPFDTVLNGAPVRAIRFVNVGAGSFVANILQGN